MRRGSSWEKAGNSRPPRACRSHSAAGSALASVSADFPCAWRVLCHPVALMIGRTRIFCAVALLGSCFRSAGRRLFLLSKRMTVAADRFFLAVEKGDLPAGAASSPSRCGQRRRRIGCRICWSKAIWRTLPNALDGAYVPKRPRRIARHGEAPWRRGVPGHAALYARTARLEALRHPARVGRVAARAAYAAAARQGRAGRSGQTRHAGFRRLGAEPQHELFYSTLAPSRREQCTTESLAHVFSPYYDIPEDLTSLQAIEPQVKHRRTRRRTGAFVLKGYFPSGPKQVRFVQKYCYEQTDWRLLSFVIDMR